MEEAKQETKITYGAVLGGIAAIAIIFAVVANIISGQYIVVAEGLDSTECSEVLTLLQDNNIPAVMESGGVIKVPKANEYETIMKLSTAGYPKDISDYSIFKDNVSLTSTEFEQNQYARFQTQEYIRAAIKTIPGVKEALVQIAESENDQYVLVSEKVDTKASAKVDMSAGYELTASQVRGIESLIANSVTGLTVDNVSVVDRNGNLLSSDDLDFVTDANTKRRLQYEKQIEDGLKQKVVDILKGPFGEDGISVAVTAILDYDRMISEELNYVPSVDDKGMVSHEDYNSVTDSNNTEAGVPVLKATLKFLSTPMLTAVPAQITTKIHAV